MKYEIYEVDVPHTRTAPPERSEKAQRWVDGAEKVAMACCEAGYPCTFVEEAPGALGVLSWTNEIPPKEVLLKAGELAGIRDLIEEAFIDPGVVVEKPSFFGGAFREQIFNAGRIGQWP